MVRTRVSDLGIASDPSGNGFDVYGREYHEAPYDQRWDDQYATIYEGEGASALTYEGFRDTGFFMRFFRHNQNDFIFMSYQMSHQWDNSTNVKPHMHYIPMSAGSGVLKFDYAYSWSMVGGALSGSTGWTSGSISASLAEADQFNQKVISFGTLTPPIGAGDSALLFVKVQRPGASDAADTYQTSKDHGTAAANVGVLFFDLHYRKIKAGSVNEFPETG